MSGAISAPVQWMVHRGVSAPLGTFSVQQDDLAENVLTDHLGNPITDLPDGDNIETSTLT